MRLKPARRYRMQATIPLTPGSVSTMPAAAFDTSVAVETAMPIWACRSAGASFRAVPTHANDMPALLEGTHQAELVLGKHAGISSIVIRTDAVRDLSLRADRPRELDGGGDACGRRGRISRDYHRSDAKRLQFCEQALANRCAADC